MVTLDRKVLLTTRSERAKALDFHPTEPWVAVGLYNGSLTITNYHTQAILKTIQVCTVPVRCARFVSRKNYIVIGTDDNHVRVYNYNTLERVADWEAHADYIRSIAIHPTKPFLLTTSDDCTVKLWDWDAQFKLVMTFEGHQHYVMQAVFNPKDPNTFATASLDRTVKVWSLGNGHCNFTLDGGHTKGVNAVAFYHGGDRPFLASASDDHTVRIWDYQSKAAVRCLSGHTNNVSSVVFHPRLPILLSGSEDGTVRVWGTTSFRCELVINAGLDRLWSVGCSEQHGEVGLAGDLGSSVMLLGKSDAAVSMDSLNGKLVWAQQSTVSQCRLQDTNLEMTLKGQGKELGQTDFVVTSASFSPSGRFVCVQGGEGEYCVYTAVAWRNRAFGKAIDFCWAAASVGNNVFAVRDSANTIRIFDDFMETVNIKTDVPIDRIFGGGQVLAASGSGYCLFYDYHTGALLQAVEQDVNSIAFSDGYGGSRWQAALMAEPRGLFIVHYLEDGEGGDLRVVFESESEVIRGGGLWIDNRAFVFALADSGKICYWLSASAAASKSTIGIQLLSITEAVSMRPLGYHDDRIYFASSTFSAGSDICVRSVKLPTSLIAFQTALLNGDQRLTDACLADLLSGDAAQEEDMANRVAKFLDAVGESEKAAQVATDPHLLFTYNCKLGRLQECRDLLMASSSTSKTADRKRWRQLADAALSSKPHQSMAGECLVKAGCRSDGLLVASLLGQRDLIRDLSTNRDDLAVAFSASYMLGDADRCFDALMQSGRFAEAAMFAQTHGNLSRGCVGEAVAKWRQSCESRPIGKLLADPTDRPDLFDTANHSPHHASEEPLWPQEAQHDVPIHEATSIHETTSIPEAPMLQQSKRKGSIKSTTSYDDDLLSVEVNTTGTGSMRTDDVDDAMAAIGVVGSLPTIHDDDQDIPPGYNMSDDGAFTDNQVLDSDLDLHSLNIASEMDDDDAEDHHHNIVKPTEDSLKDAISSDLDDLEDGW